MPADSYKIGDTRVMNGRVWRLYEIELEGEKWEDIGPAPATPAIKGEVTDEWAERFCEAVNWSPDGQECKTVEGQLRCVSFRDLAKGYILAAIATDPCTPATPEGLREKVTLARPYWNGSGNKCWSFTDEEYQAILSALQPQAEGGE